MPSFIYHVRYLNNFLTKRSIYWKEKKKKKKKKEKENAIAIGSAQLSDREISGELSYYYWLLQYVHASYTRVISEMWYLFRLENVL